MSNLKEAETKLIKGGNQEAAEALETFEFRWRYAVFPAMIAFTILSAFGFYLVVPEDYHSSAGKFFCFIRSTLKNRFIIDLK